MKKFSFVLVMLALALVSCDTGNGTDSGKEDYFGTWRAGDAILTLSATACKYEYTGRGFTIGSSTWKPVSASNYNVKDVDFDATPLPAAAADNGYFIEGIISATTFNWEVGTYVGKFAIFFDKNDTNKAYIYVHGQGNPLTSTRQ
jgi:hypothetical protein